MVNKAERAMKELGFRQVRVRRHEDVARIEISTVELAQAFLPSVASQISGALKDIGYRYVTIDLDGYRMGSLSQLLHLNASAL
jgi:uncharacterized protein